MKGFLRDDDEGIVEMASMQERMHELLEKPDVLLACQDAIHTAKKITADCGAIEKERKGHAVKMLLKLEERVGTLLRTGTARQDLLPSFAPFLSVFALSRRGLSGASPSTAVRAM